MYDTVSMLWCLNNQTKLYEIAHINHVFIHRLRHMLDLESSIVEMPEITILTLKLEAYRKFHRNTTNLNWILTLG